METVKDVLNICNAAIFYEYKNVGINDELNQARRSIFNSFHETIPVSKILITLSFIGVVILLKFNNNDIQYIIENIHDLRANILYKIGFEKVFKDDVDKIMN